MKYDIDYRVRCVKPNGDFDRIYYGHTAAEYDGPGAEEVYDLTDRFDHLSVGGRRSGRPVEDEIARGKHFFNKRIMTDEERIAGRPAVQGGGDVGVVESRDAGRGAEGVASADQVRGDSAPEYGPGGQGDGYRGPANETNCCLCNRLLAASEYQICKDCDFQTG